MLVIFLLILTLMGMLVLMTMFVFTVLHTLNCFFFLNRIAKDFHQINRLHIFILSRFQCIFNPLVGFSTHIDQEITAGYFHNIFHCRLKTMKVCSIIQEHRKIHIRFPVPQNISCPVIFRKNGCHNIQFPVCFLRCFSFCYVHS